jgi:D-alanyl-D-alanine carboxypeptidase
MMTLYLTFQALEQGKLSMNQKLRVSPRAEAQPASKLGLRRGEAITVRTAIEALVVRSANDVAVVVAESVGGTEWQFAMMMNRMAKRLGMNNTNFRNPHGLHHKEQYSTAYDVARLSVALRRDYPQYYHFFKRSKFTYKGQTYYSHNRVTQQYPGADGLKTGFINASGFNLATSVNRGGQRLVGVVLGGRSGKTRDQHMTALLNRAYTNLANNTKTTARMNVASIPVPKLNPNRMAANKVQIEIGNGEVFSASALDVVGQGDQGLPTPQLRPGMEAPDVEKQVIHKQSPSKNSNVPTPQLRP